ncbi:tRNA (adenine(58)-N(1))-methyltransferase TrmI [Candidatus Calditenuaceae archaeon HR02]|nr:tRNA (adenine(58)-N(1))-methyltransferase TrmI [Candidatus Calditenuaceae archaeon HR02]
MSELSESRIKHGDRVLIVTETGHRYFLTLRKGQIFHTADGYFETDKIASLIEGGEVRSNIGRRGVVFRPLLLEHLLSLPRRTQIIYPKDFGFILVLSGIRPGSRVVEGGTGSGVLALLLAAYVAPNGKIYSYDIDGENFPAITKMAERLGLSDVLELKKGDIYSSVEEVDLDAFIVDVPQPWDAVDQAKKSLRGGGMFVSIVPTVEQLVKTSEKLRGRGFLEYFSGELMIRPWRVRQGMTRPHHISRAHTVFIIAARKTEFESLSDWTLKLPDGLR